MRAYIQADKNGDFYNVNAFIANEDFTSFGWERDMKLVERRAFSWNLWHQPFKLCKISFG
ncbi:Uncharacterised protein [Paenibacillus macerans]|uniref:Uncharacterized protein n=1 Tax=Paenibacillus macerans TaxID=44252 RepID=A0A090ZIG3_PAEMA|nr:hypothetical protein DJ90_1031 [Paenibacillus macerans]SUD26447.1 Uncharacterised protein [Paenibacillus macerans]